MKFGWVTSIAADDFDTHVGDHVAYGVRQWGSPYFPFLLLGDLEKYGPRGTNDYSFKAWEFAPEQFLGGSVAESWEWTGPLTLVFDIRQGVMWTGNAHIGMEPRELTAYDAEFSINRVLGAFEEHGLTGFEYIDSVTATDRYTVVVEFNKFSADWSFHFGYGWLMPIYSEETVEAGAYDWQNQVGTGPFILTDFVEGSEAVYERNPNYWGTTTINGKEYPLPFIDKLVYPVIADESTVISALRTGVIDWHSDIAVLYSDSLAATSPELTQERYLPGQGHMMSLLVDQEPWTNRDVRRAMMIGTDYEAILKSVYTDGEIHAYPLGSHTPYYTPIDELPESAQVLYSNDPVLAKKMLADAGYPDGFRMKIHVASDSIEQQDVVMMLMEQWARFGVEIEPVVLEWAAIGGMNRERTLEDSWAALMVNTTPIIVFRALAVDTQEWFWGRYADEYLIERYWEIMATKDVAEQTTMWKDLAIYFLEDCAYIPFPTRYVLNCSWPWVKNHYGELECGYYNWQVQTSLIWIDQDLKAEMGF